MYEAKNFEHLLGINGLSDNLMKTHFTLYQGYVTNTNKLLDILALMLKENKTATPEYAELKRRFGWEFNGMRLHEYFFGHLTKNFRPINKNSKLYQQIVKDFGSYENWEKDFKSTSAMRGIGWTILYYDVFEKRLINVWVNEHYIGHLAGAVPLLVLDVFEHAFMLDYGTKRADYIENFFKIIDWNTVEKWFEQT